MSCQGYRGYIGCNIAFGRSVPQHIQQLVIRDYCQRNGLKFLLSATEYHEGSMILDSLLESELEGIVFYSIGLLPKDKEARKRLYSCGKDVRFAAENINKIDEELFETTFKVSNYHAGNDLPTICAQINQS